MAAERAGGISRRELIIGGGALVVGVYLGGARPLFAAGDSAGEVGGAVFAPNAFVRVERDDSVTVIVKHIEFGQGPFTGLTTLVAEEMDADWSQMRAEAAPADDETYKNLAFGYQSTGGSSAMSNSFLQMRRAGAAARQMLVEAAAEAWGVPAAEIGVERGVLRHASSDREGRFGELAALAAKREVPQEPKLKSAGEFRLIGHHVPRIDTAIKSDGRAQFTLDLAREGMRVAVVAHPPIFGARLKRVDAKAAKALPGVTDVHEVSQGVAVYARDTHSALRGRAALKLEWDESQAETRSSEDLERLYEARSLRPGRVVSEEGDAAATLENAAEGERFEAIYAFPFLAHAPMEPLDSLIEPSGEGVVASYGSQSPTTDQAAIAEVLGLSREQVEIRTLLAGGSFGRRAQLGSPFAREAAEVFAALGRRHPVKLVWSREDDIQGGYYRPLVLHRLSGSLAADGSIDAWDQTIVSQPLVPIENRSLAEHTAVEGAREIPYAIPNRRVSLHLIEVGVPVLWWRSVGHTHTAYSVETFLDELLERGGKDAVTGRLERMGDYPRERAVLERVAEMADSGGPMPEGRARGVAVHRSFGTYVAQIAEVSAPSSRSSEPRVHRVWCAVDCGLAVNPDVVVAQMEGGIGFGLGAALYGEIRLEQGGRVRERNFDGYRCLRMSEMPEVEVGIVASGEPPSGVGEPGTPPIAPAVANAWRRLTGTSVRRLPFVPVA
jgi:isoquinoline 1-oxidoreductase beta subunit